VDVSLTYVQQIQSALRPQGEVPVAHPPTHQPTPPLHVEPNLTANARAEPSPSAGAGINSGPSAVNSTLSRSSGPGGNSGLSSSIASHPDSPHPMLVQSKGGGLTELRCNDCDPPANAFYRSKSKGLEFIRGPKGLISHYQQIHPDLKEKYDIEKFDKALILRRCIHHKLSEAEVQEAWSPDGCRYYSEHCTYFFASDRHHDITL
jgi:hypothetical protein